MRVRISYSLELENVIGLINDIISGCQQNLLNESKNLKYYVGDLNKLYEEIEHTREVLSLVDTQLDDVLNMATGLENVQNPPALPEEEEVAENES